MGERHWYTRAGEPAYGASLDEARSNLLAPSYSEIEKLLVNFGLARWMNAKLIETTANLVMNGITDPDALSEKVTEIMEADREVILERGNDIHDFAERMCVAEVEGVAVAVPGDHQFHESLTELQRFIRGLCLASGKAEEAFCTQAESGLHYGGRIDFHGKDQSGNVILIDWKSQDIKPGKLKKDGTPGACRPNFYSNFARQHYGYRRYVAELYGVRPEDVICYSALISTNAQTQGVYYKVWGDDELAFEGQKFELLLKLFYLENKLVA